MEVFGDLNSLIFFGTSNVLADCKSPPDLTNFAQCLLDYVECFASSISVFRISAPFKHASQVDSWHLLAWCTANYFYFYIFNRIYRRFLYVFFVFSKTREKLIASLYTIYVTTHSSFSSTCSHWFKYSQIFQSSQRYGQNTLNLSFHLRLPSKVLLSKANGEVLLVSAPLRFFFEFF